MIKDVHLIFHRGKNNFKDFKLSLLRTNFNCLLFIWQEELKIRLMGEQIEAVVKVRDMHDKTCRQKKSVKKKVSTSL